MIDLSPLPGAPPIVRNDSGRLDERSVSRPVVYGGPDDLFVTWVGQPEHLARGDVFNRMHSKGYVFQHYILQGPDLVIAQFANAAKALESQQDLARRVSFMGGGPARR